MREFIPQMAPLFGAEEKKAVCEYMDENGFITEYKRTEYFENQIAEFCGARHCIVVNNGTISLTLAALALGIGPGDEVIVPNYTMIATPNSIKMIGAEPVFVDVEPQTLCIDIGLLEKAITSKTKAFMLVSANGRFPKTDMSEYLALAQKYNIHLIEDSAQSLGSYYPGGQHIGTVGAVGSFSFSAPKIISTGQGGALITNDDAIAYKLRRLKDFGRASGGIDLHDTVGYNFKFTELQACIGIEQMKKLPERILRKKEIYKRYQQGLDQLPQVRLFDHDLQLTTPWFIDALVENRESLMTYLKEKSIGTRKMYPPINKQSAYGISGDYPVSENVGENGLWLPSAIQLTDTDVDYICESIRSYYNS